MSSHEVCVPWAAWYEDGEERLTFPSSWEVQVAMPEHQPVELADDEIRSRLAQPIGTAALAELARGKRRVVLASDDLTRPTPTDRLLPILLGVLEEAGVSLDQITILVASGSHRFWTRLDLLKKMGPELCDTVAIYNHHPYENLVYLGQTS